MWNASAVSAPPITSAIGVAPRSRACASDSRTTTPAPSPRTNPSRVLSNGRDAVSFAIRKQSGANTVEITERVREALTRLRAAFPALTINEIQADAMFIEANVAEVRKHIMFGGLMAVLIIFVFMRDWRSTLISALALPTSVISTFFFMYVAGFTINMMTLMALSLVIGILIDDAVVVRENIYRHMELGEDPMTAARNGTAQIGLAVMATTFTILAVFLPVGFMTGIIGQFFKSFALTIAFAVAMSLLVAFTLAVGVWLGPLYTAAAAVLGAIFVALAVLLRRDLSRVRAQILFHYSLAYLALLFAAAALDPLLT